MIKVNTLSGIKLKFPFFHLWCTNSLVELIFRNEKFFAFKVEVTIRNSRNFHRLIHALTKVLVYMCELLPMMDLRFFKELFFGALHY